MKILVMDKIVRLIKNRKKLEELLEVKINNSAKQVTIEGDPEKEHIAMQIIEALDYGIPYKEAILIKKENKILELINIKEYTKKNDLEKIRGRLIGKGGKVLKTLSTLTESSIELKENTIAIVTNVENMERLTNAVIAIIKGAKHGGVYKTLEHNFPEPVFDLGLKEKPLKTMEEYEKELKKLNKKL